MGRTARVILGWLLLPVLAILAWPLKAQEEKTVPPSQAALAFSYAPVVKKAAPAVVNIYTKTHVQVVEAISPFMNDPFFRQFFGNGLPQFAGRPREQVISSLGSGVIVKPDGIIVTSYHVIKDAQQISVVLADKREFEAKVMIKDPQSDLALLQIEPKSPLPYVEMRDSDSLEVGDLVLAIGNPFGVGQTVTNGIVSALARQAAGVSDYQFFIQTDAAINPGNSGGALVDMHGQLIGINTAIYSKSGGSLGIGFAIPANMVRSLLAGKVQAGRVVRPWLGIEVQPVTPEIADSMGLDGPQGVIVKQLYADSPAGKSGLKEGDIILAVNGASVGSQADVQYRLALARIGEHAMLQIRQGGQARTLDIALEAPPEQPKRDQRTLKGNHPLAGLTVANLSPALAMELGMGEAANGGVIITGGTIQIGAQILQPGDRLLAINGIPINSTAQLEELLKKGSPNWQISYKRGGHIAGN